MHESDIQQEMISVVRPRQREVIYKIVEKAKNADVATLSKILDKVFPNIYTSFSKAEILQMGMSMLSYDIEDQTGFHLIICMDSV